MRSSISDSQSPYYKGHRILLKSSHPARPKSTMLDPMSQLETLTETLATGVEKVATSKQKTDAGAYPQVRHEDSKSEPRSFQVKLETAFRAFSNWCNRLDMDDRGFWM